MTIQATNKDVKQIDNTVNIEVEQALLGAILLNNNAFDRVNSFLRPEHFGEEIHSRIYDVVGETIRQGRAADVVTVKTFLGEHPIGNISTSEYLAQLAASAASIVNAPNYGKLIYDLFIRRKLVQVANEVIYDALYSPVSDDPMGQIARGEKKLYALASGSVDQKEFKSMAEALEIANEEMSKSYQKGAGLSGISSGFPSLDEKVGGFQPSNLIIVAGRPGMGKTAFAMNIATNVLKDHNFKNSVGFFSLEMSSEELAYRVMSEESKISSFKIKRGDLSEVEYKKVYEASKKIKELPLYIDDTGGLSIDQLISRARRLKRQKNIDLLIIDYIQYLGGNVRARDSRVNEISEITGGLKALAKELKIPIIALSQLSRQVENREDKRPQLSDLRDSGSIEQDADIVLFLYREAYYLKKKIQQGSIDPFEGTAILEDKERMAEVIIAKNRHGETGIIPIGFEPKITKFYDIK